MAARTISTTIKVDGENAFNNAMKSINSNLRVLKSALSATEAEFRSQSGSVTALSQKLKAQTNVYEQQKEKVRQLAQAVAESKVKYGENSAETDRLTTSYNRARAEMSNMEAEIKKTSQALSEAQTATQGMSGSMDELDASAENAAGGLNAWKVAAGSLLADLARKGAQIIKEVGQTGIEYNAQIEKYSTALTTALGDASKAAAAIEGIKQDAASTPYDMATLVQANSLLISTGESAENARATIMALSNAVSATGGGNDELNRMAYNLQQIKNLGKASAVDIKQFGNAGIDIFSVLADYTGKNTSEVKELTVTYELLSKALQAAAAEGGRYFGANAAQAATLNGQISTLKDNVKSKLGEAFAGASNMLSGTLLPAANRFVQSMDMGKIIADFDDLVTAAAAVGGAVAAIKLGGKIGSFADDMIASVAATRELAAEFGKAELTQAALGGEMKATQAATLLLTGGLDLATAKQMALNAAAAAFPGAAVVAGIAAVVVGIKSLADQAKETTAGLVESIKESSDLNEVSSKLNQLRGEYEALRDEFNSGYSEHTWFDVKALGDAVEQATAYYDQLAAAEAERQAYLDSTDGKIDTMVAGLEELMTAYGEAYTAAKASLEGQFDLFEQVGQAALVSGDSMIAGMDSQKDYWNSYTANLETLKSLTGESMGLNADMVASLGDGSAQSVQYVASIVAAYQEAAAQGPEAAQEFINGMNASFEGQQAALDQAAQAIAEFQTDFDSRWEALAQTAAQGASDMNQADAMRASGINSIIGYISGLDETESELTSKASEMANAFSSAFNSGINLSLPSIRGGGVLDTGGVGRFATGLERVPYDYFPAYLDKDEMVLTAAQAEAYRKGDGKGANKTVSVVINAPSIDKSTVDYIVERVNRELGA